MAVMLSLAVMAAVLTWIAVRRRFLVYLIGFLLVGWSSRLAATAWIDLREPVYAIQLGHHIGGGHSTVYLVLANLVAFAAIFIVFNPARLHELGSIPLRHGNDPTEGRRVAGMVFAGAVVFVAALFIDFARIGVVPLFAGMERYIYTDEYGGFFHGFLMKYGIIIGFFLGLFYMYGALLRAQPDRRFLYILLSLYVYLLLAGHRFSAFYGYGLFFLAPIAVLAIRRQFGAPEERTGAVGFGSQPRWLRVLITVAVVGMVGGGVYTSYFITRDYGDVAMLALEHRVLVQQGEMWWVTWDRVIQQGIYDPSFAWNRVFENSIALEGRNSSMPFLMELELGDAVHPIIAEGVQFGGGYPEIAFELFGPIGGYIMVFGMALVMAKLFEWLVRAILDLHYVGAFLVFYVLFLFLLFPASGMLNFLVAFTFWVKVAAMAIWKLATRVAAVRAIATRAAATRDATTHAATTPTPITS